MAHPAAAGMALAWSLLGVLVVIGEALPVDAPSPTLDRLPAGLVIALGILIAGGGAGLGWGITTRHGRLDRVWDVQVLGLSAGIAGWASYAVAVLATYPGSTIVWLLGLSQVLTAVLVLLSVRGIERSVRQSVDDGRSPKDAQ